MGSSGRRLLPEKCTDRGQIGAWIERILLRAHAVLDFAAQDPNGLVRPTAIRGAELLPRTDWNPIEGLLADPFPEIRAAAAKVLTRHGVRLHARDVLSLLTDLSDIAYESDLVDVFDLATGREGRALVATFAERSDRQAAFRACEALKRLDAIAAGPREGNTAARTVPRRSGARLSAALLPHPRRRHRCASERRGGYTGPPSTS